MKSKWVPKWVWKKPKPPEVVVPEPAVRAHDLIVMIETKMPEMAELVRKVKESGADYLLMHQDAFTADYQDEEFWLLGAFIKYAGTCGVNVMIVGKNYETIRRNVSEPPAAPTPSPDKQNT